MGLGEKELLVRRKIPPEPGELSLDTILKLLDRLISRLSAPEFQQRIQDLLQRYPGKQRTLEPFAKERWDLIQAEADQVLPFYGFPKGNFTQLDRAISDYTNLVT